MIALEKELETKLVREVRALGGQCLKWTSPGATGLPDRILLLPGGVIAFVELKRPKESRVAELQNYWQRTLAQLGFKAYIVHTQSGLEEILSILYDEVKRTERRGTP